MLVSEIYGSLQGEGLLAGTPSTFVRTSGCNLRCRWCDTPFTSWHPEGEEMSIDEIVARVLAEGRRHVVVTGGEPLLHDGMPAVCGELRSRGHHVTVETAGTVDSAVSADLLSVSPKLAASGPSIEAAGAWTGLHERRRRSDPLLAGLLERLPWQLKFVVDSEADVAEAVGWIADLESRLPIDRSRVFLMPQGVDRRALAEKTRWLEAICAGLGLQVAPRHHIEWFGHARGT